MSTKPYYVIITVKLVGEVSESIHTITTSAISIFDFESTVDTIEKNAKQHCQTVEGLSVRTCPHTDQEEFKAKWEEIKESRAIPFSKKFGALRDIFPVHVQTLLETPKLKEAQRNLTKKGGYK